MIKTPGISAASHLTFASSHRPLRIAPLQHRFNADYCTTFSFGNAMTKKPVRILSLDGGGVRGLSTLLILKELMAQLSREMESPEDDSQFSLPLPCDYFDLICGTSTGGLIALMLGRLRMVILSFAHCKF